MVHVQHLLQTLESLPAELQQEVVDFADFLAQRRRNPEKPESISSEEMARRRREGFGRFKGAFTVPDNFDAPLDDFKDYM